MFKPYQELACDNIDIISSKIYDFLKTNNLLELAVAGWNFVNCKELVTAIPELQNFFKQHKLLPRDAAITVVNSDNDLPIHIDELPVIAKINFPVLNTQGWVNRWYKISANELANCPKEKNQFDKDVENLTNIPLELLVELPDLKLPIVLNSRIPHSVNKTEDAQVPRIVASFTFYNEPLDLLK
jgi:hypothetical protein